MVHEDGHVDLVRDPPPITGPQATQNATDVLDLVGFGTGAAPQALNLAGITGALTTGAITAGQLPELLSLMAGANYEVPSGYVVAISGVWQPPTGASLLSDDRPTVQGESYNISRTVGHLSKMAQASYVYLGTAGRALVLYNDDGSLV